MNRVGACELDFSAFSCSFLDIFYDTSFTSDNAKLLDSLRGDAMGRFNNIYLVVSAVMKYGLTYDSGEKRPK